MGPLRLRLWLVKREPSHWRPRPLCALCYIAAMTSAKFYFAYFWFSSASGGRETLA